MGTSLRRSRLWLWVWSLLVVACAAARPSRPERATGTAFAPSPQPTRGLYAADEALRDALSGTWEYVGTGPWPGISRTQACAFRNQHVLIVNVYCTITDSQALRVDVYSPARGRVRIYAEGNRPVSARTRQEYFTFTVESEPPPGPEARMPQLTLTMSFQELRAYDERRYGAYLPACYGGQELSRKQGSCLGALAPRAGEWAKRNHAFLEHASDDWFRVVREMRALAARYGKEPE